MTNRSLLFFILLVALLFVVWRLGGSWFDGKRMGEDPLIAFDPVTARDHIEGKKDARIYVVEYEDLECPFCKNLYLNMKEVIGRHPDVGFVFRHYPLDHRFPLSRREAEAAECSYMQGGHASFFRYLDLLFQKTRSENSLTETDLYTIARSAQLDVSLFGTCYEKRAAREYVEKNRIGGVLSGIETLPSIILVKDGTARELLVTSSARGVEQALVRLEHENP